MQSTMFTHDLLDSILYSMREGLSQLLEAARFEDTPLLATAVAGQLAYGQLAL
jgi:hypothetical protein